MINDIKYLIIADYVDGTTLYSTAYSEEEADVYVKFYLDGDIAPLWVHKMRYYDLHSFSGLDGKESDVEIM